MSEPKTISRADIEYAERRWPGDAMGSVRYGYLEGVRLEREACAKVLENGRFLHDQAPTKLFATEAAAAIRRRNDHQ